MQRYNIQSTWQEGRGKKRPHWSILTLDDLPKTKVKYSQLVAQLQARYLAAKELGIDQSRQKLDDFSI